MSEQLRRAHKRGFASKRGGLTVVGALEMVHGVQEERSLPYQLVEAVLLGWGRRFVRPENNSGVFEGCTHWQSSTAASPRGARALPARRTVRVKKVRICF